MTTRQFIAKTIATTSYKNRACSSVFTDSQGTVYSYGYHYPLAAVINGIGFVNTRGYSVTTAKHISWAFSALYDNGIPAFGVPLTNGDSLTLNQIKNSAQRELDRLTKEMAAKDTRVYEWLEHQATKMAETIQQIPANHISL